MNCNVWVNGVKEIVELPLLDTVNNQTRYQGAWLPHVLIKVDVWEGFTSLAVYNAFDHASAGHIDRFAIEFQGEKIEFDNFRYLCGFRKTWGERPITPNNQTLIGYEPDTGIVDWSEPALGPMEYGKFITSYFDTGARPMLGVRECNWVQNREARIRYANQGLGLPFHIFESVAPYNAVMKDNYVMGLNNWSVKGNVSKIGMKVDGAHMSSQFLRAALIEKDRIFIDEVVHMGNYAAMHYHPTDMAQGQVRKQGRCLTAALFALHFSNNVFLENKIIAALTKYDTFASDITGIPYGRKNDPKKGWYVPWWEYAYLAYAIWQAKQFGFSGGFEWLESFMSHQAAMGTTCPYWLYLSSDAPIEEATLPAQVPPAREDSARVIGFIMKEMYGHSPWNLDSLLDDQNVWPVKNTLDFKLKAPGSNRPKTFDELVDRFLILEGKVLNG